MKAFRNSVAHRVGCIGGRRTLVVMVVSALPLAAAGAAVARGSCCAAKNTHTTTIVAIAHCIANEEEDLYPMISMRESTEQFRNVRLCCCQGLSSYPYILQSWREGSTHRTNITRKDGRPGHAGRSFITNK